MVIYPDIYRLMITHPTYYYPLTGKFLVWEAVIYS
jgi:hypothetical protein